MPTIPGSFSLVTRRHGQETILTVTGQIGRISAPQLRATLADLIDSGHRRLVLDLTAVSYCNSTGLATMIYALRRILHHDANGHIFIACDGPVLQAFQRAGVNRIFPVRASAAEAVSDALALVPAQRDGDTDNTASTPPPVQARGHTTTHA